MYSAHASDSVILIRMPAKKCQNSIQPSKDTYKTGS